MNQNNNEILLTDLAKEEINEFDSIIFDCDGVLIDVTKSYDTTINKTVSYILKEIFNITVDNPLTNEMFVEFKATGGFNDEVDITYVGILCYIAAQKLNKNSNEFIQVFLYSKDVVFLRNCLNSNICSLVNSMLLFQINMLLYYLHTLAFLFTIDKNLIIINGLNFFCSSTVKESHGFL